MEPNSTLGEPIGVVHVTINGQKVPANVYADRTCIMPDGTIRKVKQEVVDTNIRFSTKGKNASFPDVALRGALRLKSWMVRASLKA